jgi:hypothetical protein
MGRIIPAGWTSAVLVARRCSMRSLVAVGLIACFLFVAVEASARQRAGTCREPECGRTETDQTNQDRNRPQDSNRPQETSGAKDRSPCGPNPADKGFVYNTGSGKVRSDPSASSDVVGQSPGGSRLMYDRIANSGGERWYHVNPPGGRPGWVPSSDVGCTRPSAPPPYRGPIRDCNIPTAETSSAQGGARGFAPGSFCDQYQQQQEPVSLLEAPGQFSR